MSKNEKITKNSLLNLASIIAVIVSIVIWILLIINHYANWNFISTIASYLSKIKDVCLAFVVLVCAFSYASSLNKGGWKTTVYVFCAVFLVLAIVGVVLL